MHANTPNDHLAQPAGPAKPDLAELSAFEPLAPSRNGIGFADVGGMQALKQAARLKIVEPFLQPALFARYGQAAGGGLLLYGPPGCGKTMFARALAGECGAAFFNVGIQDILNLYVGHSERNLRRLFDTARAQRPAILFIDEFDALGRRRDLLRHSPLATTVNALLAELDGLAGDNTHLLVLAATNAPWDIDSAFKRPGRFDQTLFVPPPDAPARAAILQLQLANRPCSADVDTAALAERTARWSGADLLGLVQAATSAVLQSVLAGGPERPLCQADLLAALGATQPSTDDWLATARHHIEFADQAGHCAEVAAWLAQHAPRRRRPAWFWR
jgi:SpoVK/Ycf46/Vps4 family AAA+-type ATPase